MAGGPPTKIKEVLATQGLVKPCTSKLPEAPDRLSLCCRSGAWSSGEGDSPSHMQVHTVQGESYLPRDLPYVQVRELLGTCNEPH